MRDRPTVLILGAGSSFKFGLPLGNDLRHIISRDLDIRFDDFGSQLKSGSHQIVAALRHLVRHDDGKPGNINPHRAAAVQISNAMDISSSIDEYIERHRSDPLRADCAKLAIVKAIVEAERSSDIFLDHNRRNAVLPSLATSSWLAFLLRDITRGLEKQDLATAFRNIYIVNFNYDRCVEHFVYHWLQQMYEIDASEAAKVSQTLRIYHPYGSLGELPYKDIHTGTPFGSDTSAQQLVSMAKQIRTYSEARHDDTALDYAHLQISKAKSLVFLGFGFLEQNLKLLTVPQHMARPTLKYYASTKGIPRPKLELARNRISSAFGVSRADGLVAHDYDGNCEEFWDQFGEPLTQ